MNVTVVGSGGWGTALAIHLCKNGHRVTLWSHNPEKAAALAATRRNPMLPGVPLPPELRRHFASELIRKPMPRQMNLCGA